MRVVGLTGGIASGKSTVRQMFRALGATVLDADALYHELVTPDEGRPSMLAQAIDARFPGVLRSEGSLDRPTLAKRVLDDPAERQALEAIAHPRVAARFAERTRALAAAGVDLVLYDVPLLFEAQREREMVGVVVVWVPRAVQIARLRARSGVDEETAARFLAAQLPLDEKRRRATWVIDNSGTIPATRAQVVAVWPELRARRAGSAAV